MATALGEASLSGCPRTSGQPSVKKVSGEWSGLEIGRASDRALAASGGESDRKSGGKGSFREYDIPHPRAEQTGFALKSVAKVEVRAEQSSAHLRH